jgi:surface antigen
MKHRSKGWRLGALSLAILAQFLLPAVLSGEHAGAATGTVIAATGQYRSADNRSAKIQSVPAGANVNVSCWRRGGIPSGESSDMWFRGSFNGKTGWFYRPRLGAVASLPQCTDLRPGETLYSGQRVYSSDGKVSLTMQTDGNVVVRNSTGALWASKTSGSGNRLVQQTDGNLVIYRSNGSAAWSTGTMIPGTVTKVQTDANVVLYSGTLAVYATSFHRTVGQTTSANQGFAGNCTWLANEEFKKFTGKYPYSYVPSAKAADWDNEFRNRGWRVNTTPQTHTVVVFEPGVQGAHSYYGHVAWVKQVRKNSSGGLDVFVYEMNNGSTNTRWIKHVAGMSYIYAPWRA